MRTFKFLTHTSLLAVASLLLSGCGATLLSPEETANNFAQTRDMRVLDDFLATTGADIGQRSKLLEIGSDTASTELVRYLLSSKVDFTADALSSVGKLKENPDLLIKASEIAKDPRLLDGLVVSALEKDENLIELLLKSESLDAGQCKSLEKLSVAKERLLSLYMKNCAEKNWIACATSLNGATICSEPQKGISIALKICITPLSAPTSDIFITGTLNGKSEEALSSVKRVGRCGKENSGNLVEVSLSPLNLTSQNYKIALGNSGGWNENSQLFKFNIFDLSSGSIPEVSGNQEVFLKIDRVKVAQNPTNSSKQSSPTPSTKLPRFKLGADCTLLGKRGIDDKYTIVCQETSIGRKWMPESRFLNLGLQGCYDITVAVNQRRLTFLDKALERYYELNSIAENEGYSTEYPLSLISMVIELKEAFRSNNVEAIRRALLVVNEKCYSNFSVN